MYSKIDLKTAIAFCANSENHFPSIGEGCRGDSCPLHPFCTDAQEPCVRCIERVLEVTLEYLETEFNEEAQK